MQDWAKELKSGIKKSYIIYGEEEYIRQKAVNMLFESLSLNLPEINHNILDSRVKASDIVTACETLPMMDEIRLVQVKNYESLTAKGEDTKHLEDYIQKIPQSTVLLFDMTGKVDKRRKLYKTVEKHGCVKEFTKPALPKLAEIVSDEAKIRGLTVSKDTALALIEQSGQDLYTLTTELDKLMFASDKGSITKKEIMEVASKSLEYDVFSLHRLFMEGKPAQALNLLNQVLEVEKSPFGVIGLIASKFRLLLKARTMMDARYAYNDIISNMGANPYAAKEAMRDAAKFTAEEIRDMLKALSQLDYKLKSGQGGRYMTETVLLQQYKNITTR